MRKFSKGLAIFAVVMSLTAAPAPAAAEPSAEAELEKIDRGSETQRLIATIQIQAIAVGFGWALTEMEQQGMPRLYCVPPRLAMTADQIVDILREYVNGDGAIIKDQPVGLVLMYAMRSTFPCDAA